MAWGICKECKWWQVEPEAQVADATMGVCIDETMQPHRLLMSGNGGCDLFMEGDPARAMGSSQKPPTAQPQR